MTAGSASAAAQPSPGHVMNVRPDSALASALAADLVAVAQLPGISVAALDRGRVVFAGGAGFSDLERKTPVDSGTVYGSASVAKIVTATALLRLVQANRFDLDAPVSKWLPDFPGGPRISARQLAAHMGGIPHYGYGSMPSDARHVWATGAVGEFANARRIGEPGEKSVYSTHGITLLSALMEQNEQRAILDIFQREVFGPFDMRSSGGLFADSLPPRLATYYERANGTLRPRPPLNLSYSWAGAGLRFTPSDLVRMARAYFDGTFTPATLQTAFEEQRTSRGEPTGLGIIWRIERDWRGRALAHHAGVTRGTRSVLLMRRDEQRAVSVMTNLEWTSSIERTANVFAEALFDSSPRTAPLIVRGSYAGTLDSVAVSGAVEINGDTGWLTTPAPLQARFAASGGLTAERLRVRAIRDDLYALVTPWGLFPMEMTRLSNTRVRARVQVASMWLTLESGTP